MTSLEDLRKALDKCPKIKAGFVPKKEDDSYDWESLSIKQELKLIRFDTWRKLVEAKFSVFKADYDLQIHVPHKQLSEEIEHAHEKAEYWKDKDELRQIWVAIELSYKQLLEASDSLSPKEVKDVAIARKELASGKCKTFKTADEMIADLHEK